MVNFQSEMKEIGGERLEHLGFNKNKLLFSFYFPEETENSLSQTCRNTSGFNLLILSVNQKKRRDILSRTRHQAGLEKQPKPFVGAEVLQGPGANF